MSHEQYFNYDQNKLKNNRGDVINRAGENVVQG